MELGPAGARLPGPCMMAACTRGQVEGGWGPNQQQKAKSKKQTAGCKKQKAKSRKQKKRVDDCGGIVLSVLGWLVGWLVALIATEGSCSLCLRPANTSCTRPMLVPGTQHCTCISARPCQQLHAYTRLVLRSCSSYGSRACLQSLCFFSFYYYFCFFHRFLFFLLCCFGAGYILPRHERMGDSALRPSLSLPLCRAGQW